MECTQRLECTQDLYESRPEIIYPEQIGFLGICGVKHPVKRGPNKIGRDPQTCSIVLNLNSISRQHAVINILNHKEFMLMDLDSANKTKLMDKTLPAYIPHPLRNGDMVQFGDVFGVFRLLEEETDLPMTQAIDIPETPVSNKHMSKLTPVTTIPESPDVSDREESFIAPSQPKKEHCFKNSNSQFIKPSSKIISIQPVGSSKIDNVYWNSSKKSVSLNSQFDSSLNSSTLSDKASSRESNDASIFEMETQPPATEVNDTVDSIYTADTQVPTPSPSIHTANTQVPNASSSIHTANTQVPSASPSIHTANTQVPIDSPTIHNADTQITTISPTIHSLDTQLPQPSNYLPEVCKIENQQEMQFDLNTSNKQCHNIYDAATQPAQACKSENVKKTFEKTPVKSRIAIQISKNLNVSDEVILFDDMECDQFEDDFASQPLISSETLAHNDKSDESAKTQSTKKSKEVRGNPKKEVVIHSDSSTDCEDIDMLPSKTIAASKADEDDEELTDCEDLFSDVPIKIIESAKDKVENIAFDDMLTQVIEGDVKENKELSHEINKSSNDVNLEDMLTQVIAPENDDLIRSEKSSTTENIINIEDLPTQVIVADDDVIITEKLSLQNDTDFEDMPTQVISNLAETAASTSYNKEKAVQNNVLQNESPFKIPMISPIKIRRKDIKVITPKCKPVFNKASPISVPDDDENYYSATQDILDDLYSQEKSSDVTENAKNCDFVPSSVEEYEVGNRFPHLENLSPKKKQIMFNKSSESSDGDEKVTNFVSKLSSQQVRDIVGAEPQVAALVKVPSDSDIESTPKKVRPIKFMDIDLPSSQEIKTSVSVYNKTVVTESSSDSEIENDSEECTPILFHKKRKPKVNAKVDLTKVFEAEALPTRVITRVRKPTAKYQNSEDKKISSNILKPKYLTEQEDDIDKEIITENITRLKNKSEKSKNKECNKSEKVKKENSSISEKVEKENTTLSEKVDNKNKTKPNKSSLEADKFITPKSKVDGEVSKQINKEDKTKAKFTNTKKRTELKSKSNEKNTPTNEHIIISSKAMVVEDQVTNIMTETNTTSRSTRSTRNKRKVETDTTKEISSISLEKDSQNENLVRSTRRQNSKKIQQIDLTEDVVEVRRSVRQKPSRQKKEKLEDKTKRAEEDTEKSSEKIKKPTKRGKPLKHEQSTVYSLSSESGNDSPMTGKRSATADLDPPSPKRTRSAVNTNSSVLRSTPARMNKTHHVLFTAFPSEEVKTKLEKLGAMVVTDVSACTVVLTLQVKRTFKLLCAVGLGRPIVGPSWVQACVDTNMIVDPWLYILKDEAAEKRFQFNLERTLTGKRNFLKGYNVSSTPKVMPTTPEMKLIVESSGGVWKEEGPQWICVSCSADKPLWPSLKRKGATVVSTEFILGGVLRQKADVAGNKLH